MEEVKHKNRIFYVLFCSVFTAMLGLGIVGPLMPIYASKLGASGLWIGIMFSAFSVSRLFLSPIIGRISDKRGRKPIISIGLLIYFFSSLLYLKAPDVYWFTIVRFVHGAASGMVIPIAMAYIGETTKEGMEGRTMGTFNIAFFSGMGAGPFIGGVLNNFFGLNSVFYAMAFLTAVSFIITLLFLPDVRSGGYLSIPPIPFKTILKNNTVKALLVFRAFNAMGRGGLLAFLPIYAALKNIDSSKLGILLSVNIFLTALLQRPFGNLADKYNRFLLIIIGSLIFSAPLIFIPFASDFKSLLLISVIMGLGGAISIPAASAAMVDVGRGEGMGVSMGLFSMAMSVGLIFAPLVLGLSIDVLGLNAAFYVAGALGVIGVLIFYFFSFGHKRSKNNA